MSVSCSFFYRHATLINNVYPSGPGEEGPKPSALSLLIFYASSKPQKMPKIGAFLEKRVQKDMQKSRFGHVKVSLKILTATMSECQQHTGLISKSVLRIVLMVLQCPDPDVVLEATNTFVLFNSNHNHESVVDEEFGSIYLNLVEKFCAEATSQIGESNIKHKQRLSGLKALESLCDNASFLKRADLSKYMSTIVPALLLNLSDKTSVTKSKESLSPRRLSIQDSLITDDELKNICNHCLDALFSNSNAASAKIILMPLFRDLDDKKQWPNSVYVLRVFKTIFHALKGEYRYVLVAHIFERIKMEPDLAIKTTLVNALRVFMTSGSGLMSLTIPELLETLVSHLAQFCSKKAADPLYENALKESIISAIAALASHPHYPNQVNDVISILTNKIDNPMDDKPMNCDTHVINLLNAISQCLKPPAPEKRRASIVNYASIEYEQCRSLLSLVLSPNAEIRTAFYHVLHLIMGLIETEARQDHDSKKIEEFCSIIRHQMYKLVQLDQLEPGDCVIFGRCLRDLMHINNTKELPYSIPLVFQVQNLLTQDNVSISKQRAIGSILIEYLLCVADKFGINDLQEYLLSIKQQRLDALQWYPGVDLSTESLYVMDQRKFIEDDTFKPIQEHIDQERVVKMLSAHLKVESTQEFQQLETALKQEFDHQKMDQLMNLKSPRDSVQKVVLNDVVKKAVEPQPKKEEVVDVDSLKRVLSNEETAEALETVRISVPFQPQLANLLSGLSQTLSPRIKENDDAELDWLVERGRTASKQIKDASPIISRSASRKKKKSEGVLKLKEPNIFDIQDD